MTDTEDIQDQPKDEQHESMAHKRKKLVNHKPDYKAQVVELTEDLQRIQADYINYRRRTEEEKIRAISTGKEQALLALIPVLDNIERAVAHEPENIKDHTWVKGISAVAKQLEDQMQTLGLKKIGIVGEEFDPHKHEAVSMDDQGGDIEVVAVVLQTGYQFNDAILRPAMVKVNRISKEQGE